MMRWLGVLPLLLSLLTLSGCTSTKTEERQRAIEKIRTDAKARLEADADAQEQAQKERATRIKAREDWLALDTTKAYTSYLCSLPPGNPRDSEWAIAEKEWAIVPSRGEEIDRAAWNFGRIPISCPAPNGP
jgi:hypothetical protein